MRISEIITEDKNNKNNHPFSHLLQKVEDGWFDKHVAELIVRFPSYFAKKALSPSEAATIIASNDSLFDAIVDYKQSNQPFSPTEEKQIVSIVQRVKPIDKVFYRGTETESYDDKHVMAVQSWSLNVATAKMFGDHIWQTVGKVQGIEIGEIFYMRDMLFGGGNGLGDSQAEWLLLNPKKKLI